MNAPDPSTYPSAVSITTAAAFVRLDVNTVRRWADRGKIPARNLTPNSTRYVPVTALLDLCNQLLIEPNWDALADAA
jgi:hypothetical protein